MADAAARFGGTVKLARPQRDVRFSPDKRPYKQNLFGVAMPDAVLKRMETAKDQQAEGRRICIELVQQLRGISGVAGVHLMSPARPIAELASLLLACAQ